MGLPAAFPRPDVTRGAGQRDIPLSLRDLGVLGRLAPAALASVRTQAELQSHRSSGDSRTRPSRRNSSARGARLARRGGARRSGAPLPGARGLAPGMPWSDLARRGRCGRSASDTGAHGWSSAIASRAEVAIAVRPKHEMERVRHEAVSQQTHRQTHRRLAHRLKECGVILGLVNDLGPGIAAIQDVMTKTGLAGAGRPRHPNPFPCVDLKIPGTVHQNAQVGSTKRDVPLPFPGRTRRASCRRCVWAGLVVGRGIAVLVDRRGWGFAV